MDNVLKEGFRSVLIEELEPINKRLVVIEKDVEILDVRPPLSYNRLITN